MRIADALQWVKEYNFDTASAEQLLADSAAAGEHPHEHIRDWTADGSHIGGTDRDRGGVGFRENQGLFTMPSSTTWSRKHALTALVFALNSDAGEKALTELIAQPNNGRVTIQSRSGGWASSYEAEDRYVGVFDDAPTYTDITSVGVTLVLKKVGADVVVVTFFPRDAFAGNEAPSADRDLVIQGPNRWEYPATDYSLKSYTNRASKWFRGSYVWVKHLAGA